MSAHRLKYSLIFVLLAFLAVALTQKISANEEETFGITSTNDRYMEHTEKGITIKYVKDEVLVAIEKDKIDLRDKNILENIRHKYFELTEGLENEDEIYDQNVVVYKIKDGTDPILKVAELKENPFVKSVSLNIKHERDSVDSSISNDPDIDSLWGLNNEGQVVNMYFGTNDADIDWPETISLNTGNSDVIVAVVDEGVEYSHPELDGIMWDGENCKDYNGNSLGNCNHGYDFENDDTTPLPNSSSDNHGTHIAGTIAAERNNGTGISGITPRAKIMAIKTDLTSSQLIKAYNFAKYNGAKVINASYGGVGYDCDSVFIQAEYDAIASFPGLFVTAAGNDTLEHDGENIFGYSDWGAQTECWEPLSNFISVAASDSDDELASFSDYGETFIHIAAPGDNIYSTLNEDDYGFKDGTSMATPHVAAAAAYLWSYKSDAAISDVKTALLNHGDDFIPGYTISGKRLNLYSSLYYFISLYSDDGVDIDFSSDKKGSKYKYGTKIDLSIDDDRVSKIEYRWNDSDEWKTFTNRFSVKEGENELHIRALDSNGNVVSRQTKTIKAEKSDLIYDLKAKELNSDNKTVELSWSSRGNDISKFMVYRIVNNPAGVTTYKELIAILDKSEDSFTDQNPNLGKSKTLYYKVTAYNKSGEKEDMQEVSVELPWEIVVKSAKNTNKTPVKLSPVLPGDAFGITY